MPGVITGLPARHSKVRSMCCLWGKEAGEACLFSRLFRGLGESRLPLPTSCTCCDHLQVFDELDKIGKSLAEAQDGGLPVHDGKGDLRKCPYYADKLGRLWTMTQLPHVCGIRPAALTAFSVFQQVMQDPAVPTTVLWLWQSSPWCS